MTFKIENASRVFAVTVLAVAALLGVGCGSGDDGSERAVKWGIDRPVGLNWVRLSAVIDSCSPEPPLLEEPIIEYDGNRVEIELRQTPDELEEGENGCFLNLLVAYKKITFNRDLDELVLYDSSTDPPEKRWPPEKRRPTTR
jgi:hypothetical protein